MWFLSVLSRLVAILLMYEMSEVGSSLFFDVPRQVSVLSCQDTSVKYVLVIILHQKIS